MVLGAAPKAAMVLGAAPKGARGVYRCPKCHGHVAAPDGKKGAKVLCSCGISLNLPEKREAPRGSPAVFRPSRA